MSTPNLPSEGDDSRFLNQFEMPAIVAQNPQDHNAALWRQSEGRSHRFVVPRLPSRPYSTEDRRGLLIHGEIHLICDNYGTHKHRAVKQWLTVHPRIHLHFTPTSASSLNLVVCNAEKLTHFWSEPRKLDS